MNGWIELHCKNIVVGFKNFVPSFQLHSSVILNLFPGMFSCFHSDILLQEEVLVVIL